VLVVNQAEWGAAGVGTPQGAATDTTTAAAAEAKAAVAADAAEAEHGNTEGAEGTTISAVIAA
jgi:hypothetical protein